MSLEILIIDSVPAFSDALSSALGDAGFNVKTVREITASHEPICVVFGVRSPDEWVDVASFVEGHPEACVITVIPTDTVDEVRRAIKAGASGVVARTMPVTSIVSAIALALDGRVMLPLQAVRELCDGANNLLAAAEVVWLQALADGVRIADLALRHGFSEREMYRRLKSTYRKLGAAGRTDALMNATQRGLIR